MEKDLQLTKVSITTSTTARSVTVENNETKEKYHILKNNFANVRKELEKYLEDNNLLTEDELSDKDTIIGEIFTFSNDVE